MMKNFVAIIVVMGVCFVVCAENLVTNGDFERNSGWSTSNKKAITFEKNGGRGNTRCLSIAKPAGFVSVRQYNIKLKPGTEYKLAAWMKKEKFEQKKAGLGLINAGWKWNSMFLLPDVSGEWVKVEVVFTPPVSANGRYSLVLFSQKGLGKLWLDDVALNEVSADRKKN